MKHHRQLLATPGNFWQRLATSGNSGKVWQLGKGLATREKKAVPLFQIARHQGTRTQTKSARSRLGRGCSIANRGVAESQWVQSR
jgi:hypothetical protein